VAERARFGQRPWLPGATVVLPRDGWRFASRDGREAKIVEVLPTNFQGGVWRPEHKYRKGAGTATRATALRVGATATHAEG
jgi:hypothetical protein